MLLPSRVASIFIFIIAASESMNVLDTLIKCVVKIKSTLLKVCKYFKNPTEASVASSAFVPENSSSNIQKCLSKGAEGSRLGASAKGNSVSRLGASAKGAFGSRRASAKGNSVSRLGASAKGAEGSLHY